MAITVSWVNAASGVPSYTGQVLRNLESGMISGGRRTLALGVRGGVYQTNGQDLQVSILSGYTYQVRPGKAVVPATSAAQGAYTVHSDTAVSSSTTSADPTLSRVDSIYLRVLDTDLGDASKGGEVGYAEGTPASVPTAPSIPNNSIRLADITVPPAGGALSVTDRREWLTAPGGVVVTTSSQRANIAAVVGQLAFETDSGLLYVRTSGGWTLLVDSNPAAWSNIPYTHPNYTDVNFEQRLQQRRDGNVVTLRGAIRRTPSGNVALGNNITLLQPGVGFRPSRPVSFTVGASMNGTGTLVGSARIDIQTNGDVKFWGSGEPSWVAIDGVSYRTD